MILKISILNVILKNDIVYVYLNNRVGFVINILVLNLIGNGNYGIYSVGIVVNNGNINFGIGIGNVGMYSIFGGIVINNVRIIVGVLDVVIEKFGIGMVVGYKLSDLGNIINSFIGVINVIGKNSIGMYVIGFLLIVINKGIINFSGENLVGMYFDNGVIGINEGIIIIVGFFKGVKGVVLSNNLKLINRVGVKININFVEGFGIYRVNFEEINIIVVNYGDIIVGGGVIISGEFDFIGGKLLEKIVGGVLLKLLKGINDINIIVNGKLVLNVEKVINLIGYRGDVLIFLLGMYVDILRGINLINGLSKFNVKKVELLYGVEVVENLNLKYFEVFGKILKLY